MKKEIIINSTVNEVRAAITEDGKLAEYFIEFPEKEKLVGSIFLGRVSKIMQGINAAFIDIGFDNDAFLHFSDVDESLEKTVIIDEEDDDDNLDDLANAAENKPEQENLDDDTSVALRKSLPSDNGDSATFSTKRSGDIKINIQEGQDIIVQVTREAYSNKGVKVTSKIAIPGRYLVLLPFDKLLGVSRKISSFPERKRLRKLTREFKHPEFGCIIRTAAKNHTQEELKSDWDYLMETWKKIEENVKQSAPPTLLYKDITLSKSIVRDLVDKSVKSIQIDSKKIYKEIQDYLKWVSPHISKKVHYYNGKEPIFDKFNVEKDILNLYRRNVRLPSGGSIVFDYTEAMIVVDVNSGRHTGSDQEKTAFNANMEALKEITKQIRLRDIGGMIVIDFIDMTKDSNRKKLFSEFKKEMSRDRAKWVVYPLTQLGLLQITRQRINQNISEKVTEICPTCKGTGRITSSNILFNHIERWLKNFKSNTNEFKLLLKVHPTIADELTKGTISKVSKLMFKYFLRIKVLQDDTIPQNQFKFFSVRNQKEITRDYLN